MEQAQGDNSGYGRATMSEHQPNQLTQLQLLTSDILEDIEHQLRGELYNETTDQWEQKGKKMIKSEDGIRDILGELYTFLNRNVILSELTDEEIRKLTMELSKSLVFSLGKKADEYTDNNTSDLSSVVRTVSRTAFFTMKRAKDRGEGKLLGQTTTYVERNTEDNGGKFPGIFGRNKRG